VYRSRVVVLRIIKRFGIFVRAARCARELAIETGGIHARIFPDLGEEE